MTFRERNYCGSEDGVNDATESGRHQDLPRTVLRTRVVNRVIRPSLGSTLNRYYVKEHQRSHLAPPPHYSITTTLRHSHTHPPKKGPTSKKYPADNHGPQTQTPRTKVRLIPSRPPRALAKNRKTTHLRLLRRVDLTTPYTPSSNHAHALLRRYHITTPSTLDAYSRIVGAVHQLATRLTRLPPDDGVRVRLERALCEKLFDLGVLDTKPDGAGGAGLSRVVRKVGVGALVRRRLAVVMVRAGLCAGGVKAVSYVLFFFGSAEEDGAYGCFVGYQVHRTGPCSRRDGGCYGSGVFGYEV